MNPKVNKPSIRAATALVLALLGASAQASGHTTLQALRDAVIAFVIAQHPADSDVDVTPDALDSRLRLDPCPEPLEAFWAPGSARAGQVSVGVRCAGGRPWKLYVPARVRLMQPVAVAARPLARGQRLSAADLEVQTRDVGELRDAAVRDPRAVIGYVMTRPLGAGRVLHAGALQAPVLVERGRRVRMAVEAAGVEITMAGLALESGALGETVRVRNPASRRVVEGIVVGPSQVRLRASAGALRRTANR